MILDCSAPYYMDKVNKYQCTMKLIDATVNPEKGTPEWISLTIFAKTADEVPRVSKAGSIIRLHRAQTKAYKKTFQLNCDVEIKGAWILFDPSDGVTPIRESGLKYTFTAEDKTLLTEARKFAKNYFTKFELPAITLEEAEKKAKDFDVLCLVMDVKKKGKESQVKLCDAGKVVKLKIPESRNLTVTAGEVIRVRSANYTEGKKFDTLELNEYSNILRIPADFKSAKDLMKAVNSGKASEKVKSKLAVHTPHLTAPMTGSKITDNHKQTKAVALADLFAGNAGKEGQKYFKIHASVSAISPKTPKDWIGVIEKKTKKQYPL